MAPLPRGRDEVTEDGRNRLVAAIQSARTQLGQGSVTDANLHVLLFGPGRGTA